MLWSQCVCFPVFSVSVRDFCEYTSVCFLLWRFVYVYFAPFLFFKCCLSKLAMEYCFGARFCTALGMSFLLCTMRPSSPSGLRIMLQIYPNKHWAKDTGIRSWLHHCCLHYWFYCGLSNDRTTSILLIVQFADSFPKSWYLYFSRKMRFKFL